MKPKTLDDIAISYLDELCFKDPNIVKCFKEEIVELFKGCVPREFNSSLPHYDLGYNDCRSQTLKNMDNLK